MRGMQRVAAVVLLAAMLAAACGGGDNSAEDAVPVDDSADAASDTGEEASSTTAPTTTVTIPEAATEIPDLQIDLIEFGDAGFVQIVNNGDADASVAGIFLCQFPIYIDLGEVIDGGTIAAGTHVQVDAATIGGLNIAGGEAALYSARQFTNPEAIFAFVQWGTGGARVEIAAAAGIWPSGATIEPDPAFGNIELFGDPADPESWS